jgi:tryptophan synthase alpha chain
MLMNRIDKLFKEKTDKILSVYFTAGYPGLDSTAGIIKALADSGVDMIEIGMPFSDPVADGPVIQQSNEKALNNGMNLNLLFDQLSDIRSDVQIPLLLMGYLNPVMQFGVARFCSECERVGIDGIILPDLPPIVYKEEYESLFRQHNLFNIMLITPQSSEDRILEIDRLTHGFIYMVSSSSVTGSRQGFSNDQISYFERISNMKLKNPCLTGFGISDHNTFINASKYSRGGIIGSAFIKILEKNGDSIKIISDFISAIRKNRG